jgi:hypothetical protein
MSSVQPAQTPSTEIAPARATPKTVLLSIGSSLIVGAVAAGLAIIFSLGLLGAAGIGVLAGTARYAWRDRLIKVKAMRVGLPAIIISTIVIAIPWAVIYFGAKYVLAPNLLPFVLEACIGAYAYNWIRSLFGGLKSIREAKRAEAAQA